MARAEPGSRIEVDPQICGKIRKIMDERRYRGSFTSFVESVLDQFADGLLVDAGAVPRAVSDVHAVYGAKMVSPPAAKKKSA